MITIKDLTAPADSEEEFFLQLQGLRMVKENWVILKKSNQILRLEVARLRRLVRHMEDAT
jgi:hypothetical protein